MKKTTTERKTPALRKLQRRDIYPDMNDLGKADNLLRQMRYGLGFDPLAELVGLYRDLDTSTAERIRIASELLSYTHPKMKAIQANPDQGEVITINVSYPDEQGATELASGMDLQALPESTVLPTDEILNIVVPEE